MTQDPNQKPQAVPPQAPAPYIAGPIPGYPQPAPTPFQTRGHTVVNSTNDPRIIWEDGKIAIIIARDFPAGTGMGRGPTRKSVPEAIQTNIDPSRTTAVGSGSANDYCKVVLSELLARPLGGTVPPPPPPPGTRPAPTPMVASGYGHVPKGTIIPDGHFPHICGMCGGWYYQGTGEHAATGMKCPAGPGPVVAKKRR